LANNCYEIYFEVRSLWAPLRGSERKSEKCLSTRFSLSGGGSDFNILSGSSFPSQGINPTVNLPLGTTQITLTIIDNDGNADDDDDAVSTNDREPPAGDQPSTLTLGSPTVASAQAWGIARRSIRWLRRQSPISDLHRSLD
jgi:hypothetical protein